MPLPAQAGAELPAAPAATTSSLSRREWVELGLRLALALVFLWFGLHELLQPKLWTGYVPIVSAASTLAVVGVLAHGWLLTVLGVALALGVAPRTAASVGALLMLEIVISLVAHGVTDVVVRDFAVMGLAVAVASSPSSGRFALGR